MNNGLERNKAKTKRTLKPKELKDLSITVNQYEEGARKFNKASNWIKQNVFKATFDFNKRAEATKAIALANGEYQRIEILSSRGFSKKKINYFTRLLKSFTKRRDVTVEEFFKEAMPVRIKVVNPTGEKTAWVCLNQKNEAHGKTGKLTNQTEYGFELMWDFQTILAETYLLNDMYRFKERNEDDLHDRIVEYCYKIQMNKEHFLIPKEKEYQNVVMRAAKRTLPVNIFVEHDRMEDFRSYFEAHDLKQFMILNWLMNPYLKTFPKVKIQKDKMKIRQSTKVYETSKRIKPNVLEIMKDNAFLMNYGEVELHNDIDLEKFKQLEKDFIKLKEHIHIPVCKDYSFRIKKLGNHNAAGLHYPSLKNVIIDVSSPDSYVHELGHQIDNIYSGEESLSSKDEFKEILLEYKKLVQKEVKLLQDGHHFKKEWYGKSKYNSRYYLSEKEVFARCFEMYVDEVSEKTTLAKDTLEHYLYPKVLSLRKKITSYFNSITIVETA